MNTNLREEVYSSLLTLRRRLSEENLTIRDLLQPYNRLSQTYIQENDFLRALKPFPTAPIIARAYSRNGIISINEIESALRSLHVQPPEPPKTPPYIIYTLALHFQRRNIDCWSLFSSRDRVRSGKLDVSLFTSLLYSTGIRISQNDINDIVNFYKVDGQVNYSAFAEDVRKAVADENKISKSMTIDQPASPDINSIIELIKSECKKRKVFLSGFFEGYDSPMTFYAFTRIINSANFQLSPQEINFLAKFCQNENGTVDPSIIINKVDQLPTFTNFLSDADNVVAKIKLFLDERQIYLTPRFEKFDREKSGQFPVSLVGSVLSQFEFPLTQHEIDCLQKKYPGTRMPFIKWKDLDADIEPESVISKYEQMQTIRKINESTPKPKLSSATSSHLFKSENDLSQPNKVIPKEIEPILGEIAKYEIKHSIVVFDDLREMDDLKLGFILPKHFNSYVLGIIPRMPQNAINALIQYYGNQEFSYIEFCKDVAFVKKILTSNSAESSYLTQQINSSSLTSSKDPTDITNPNLKALIKKLKAFTLKNIISPIDIFNINDKTGTGYIPANRLVNCFASIRFHVTQEEVSLLIDQFCSKDFPDRFLYILLVNILDNMKMDAADVKWTLTPELARSQIDDSAHLVNCQIHAKLVARRKNIQDYFVGAPHGPISSKEFIQRVGRIDIVLEAFEIQILLTKYKSSEDDTKIDWEKFCNDVHNVRLF